MNDLRFAALSSNITNIARALYPEKGKEPEWTVPLDFMPGWYKEDLPEKKVKRQSTEEIKKNAMMLFGSMIRKKKNIKR